MSEIYCNIKIGVPGGIERGFYDIIHGSYRNKMEKKFLRKRDSNAPSTIVVEARGGFGPGNEDVWDIYLNVGKQYKIGDR